MATLSTRINCPACHHAMVTRVMACPECNLRIESNFSENEFARLDDEWLHFLRIFVHCEGRIRDMEAALGISYPTVKARITDLKQRLATKALSPQDEQPPSESTGGILDLLESGEIDYDEAIQRIKGPSAG